VIIYETFADEHDSFNKMNIEEKKNFLFFFLHHDDIDIEEYT
jgi:hypothetical protein